MTNLAEEEEGLAGLTVSGFLSQESHTREEISDLCPYLLLLTPIEEASRCDGNILSAAPLLRASGATLELQNGAFAAYSKECAAIDAHTQWLQCRHVILD